MPGTSGSTSLTEFIDGLTRSDRIGEAVVHRCSLPAEPARVVGHESLPPALQRVVDRLGIDGLYSHQAEAIGHARAGRDVAVVTPTASGKSLVFYLPTIEAVLSEPGARALYVFPFKALEQDQLGSLRALGRGLFSGVDLSAEIYDGDTPSALRKKIRAVPPDVLVTNPDMLHFGILAHHGEWQTFFERLRIVVLDELHVYRGIFGSHFAHVVRRLWRICAHYGSHPRLIVCSATVGNPGRFTAALTAREPVVIADSGAPRPARHFVFVNPSGSPYTAATALVARSVEAGFQTIAFTKARKVTELMHSWLAAAHPQLRGRIASYRAGYLPEERRDIERRLFRGELSGVITTSALELGIDVGGLDVCILVGYPGSMMSARQRAGRVGRQGRDSLTVFVALPDALDQYFMKRPQEYFTRPFEPAVLDPGNRDVAGAHLVCAGAELPLRGGGPAGLTGTDGALYPGAAPVVEALVEDGRLVRDAAGERLFALKRRPHRDVSLRSSGESFTIVNAATRRPMGSIDGVRVFHECHEGAIYLHSGVSWQIVRLDLDARRVEAAPIEADYYTQAIGDKETEILETWSEADRGPFHLGLGRLKVTVRISGYEKRRIFSASSRPGDDVISRHPLEAPPIVFETVGFWIRMPDALEREVTHREGHFMGGLHGSEHAMISLFPLLALCDRGDIGGISYSRNPQLAAPAIFIYDGYPGGIGLAAAVHDGIEELLERTRELLATCPCEDGCPSCIQSPRCGSGNRPLDKTASRMTLEFLCGRLVLEAPEAGAPPRFEAPALPAAVGSATGSEDATTDSSARIDDMAPVPHPDGASVPGLTLWPGRPRAEEGRVLFFDVETQRSAEEVGGWANIAAMGLALAVVYEPAKDEYRTYAERDVDRLLLDLMAADKVVGYNIDRFDVPVLSPYTIHDLARIRTFDMLPPIRQLLGFRLSLGHLAEANLDAAKSGDGLQSLRWWKEGRLDLIESYCRRDVELTAKVFFLGRERGYLLFRDGEGRPMRLPVSW